MDQTRSGDDLRIAANARVLLIATSSAPSATSTIDARTIQVVAYFADVLAPLWDIAVLYPQVLKNSGIRRSPEIQHVIDGLVGRGLLVITDIAYEYTDNGFELLAQYYVNTELARPVLEAISRRERGQRESRYISELTTALMGLGTETLWLSALADATYGDDNVDTGTVVDVLPLGDRESRSVKSAKAFQGLVKDSELSSAELTNLYVRHLYAVLAGKSRDVAVG